MWWECSECGATAESRRAPIHCNVCGTAGVVFVEANQFTVDHFEAEDLKSAWLLEGVARAEGRPLY